MDEYKVSIKLNPNEDEEYGYWWCVLRYSKELGWFNVGFGRCKTYEKASKAAYEFYESFKKSNIKKENIKMKFTDKDMERHSLIKGKYEKPCIICGEKTVYIDFCSEGHICSTECEEKFNRILNNEVTK